MSIRLSNFIYFGNETKAQLVAQILANPCCKIQNLAPVCIFGVYQNEGMPGIDSHTTSPPSFLAALLD